MQSMPGRIVLTTILGLLFCCLITLEFPELLNLNDDTSNDYSLVIFGTNAGDVMQEQAPGFPPKTEFESHNKTKPIVHVQPHTSSFEVTEVLHLLCIQRT